MGKAERYTSTTIFIFFYQFLYATASYIFTTYLEHIDQEKDVNSVEL